MHSRQFLFFSFFILMMVQAHPFAQISKKAYAEKVKQEFLHAWNGYKKFAWGHDELKPISNTYHDWHIDSFVLTPLDAFDTMIIMGLNEEADHVKELIFTKLDFDKDIEVQNFETTIRILGSLLSAYELDGDEKFLNLAIDLTERLMPVFNSPTGMPYRYVNLKTSEVRGEVSNPAEIGTLLLEYGILTRYTGSSKYYDAAKNAILQVYKRLSDIGLVGTTINIETGEWIDKTCHISGMIDSYYEYLLKGWLLFNDNDLMQAWENSIAAVNKYLVHHTEKGFWYSHVDMNTGNRIRTRFGALDAFFPAVLALSGDIDRAKLLQESCYNMWMLYEIEPEQFNYLTNEVISPQYYLRPENIESAYYLYHLTKDEKYLLMGVNYLESLIKYCKTESGYAALENVITKEKSDRMESFFLAETLKYLYLLFSENSVINLDEVIFNTEAHPFSRKKK